MSGAKRDYFDFIEEQEIREMVEQFAQNLREQSLKDKQREEFEKNRLQKDCT